MLNYLLKLRLVRERQKRTNHINDKKSFEGYFSWLRRLNDQGLCNGEGYGKKSFRG
ncbi:hypothetical protein MCO_01448 [Bartonella sp. DB5-6]|nr:hypothetical protein MCO_01448 [Bartonella sp. DB5-6]